MQRIKIYIVVGTGGALGSLLRATIGSNVIYNFIAAILIGLFYKIYFDLNIKNQYLKPFVVTGFLGGLSSYSAFIAFSSQHLVLDSLSNYVVTLIFQIVVGLFGVKIGTLIGGRFTWKEK